MSIMCNTYTYLKITLPHIHLKSVKLGIINICCNNNKKNKQTKKRLLRSRKVQRQTLLVNKNILISTCSAHLLKSYRNWSGISEYFSSCHHEEVSLELAIISPSSYFKRYWCAKHILSQVLRSNNSVLSN